MGSGRHRPGRARREQPGAGRPGPVVPRQLEPHVRPVPPGRRRRRCRRQSHPGPRRLRPDPARTERPAERWRGDEHAREFGLQLPTEFALVGVSVATLAGFRRLFLDCRSSASRCCWCWCRISSRPCCGAGGRRWRWRPSSRPWRWCWWGAGCSTPPPPAWACPAHDVRRLHRRPARRGRPLPGRRGPGRGIAGLRRGHRHRAVDHRVPGRLGGVPAVGSVRGRAPRARACSCSPRCSGPTSTGLVRRRCSWRRSWSSCCCTGPGGSSRARRGSGAALAQPGAGAGRGRPGGHCAGAGRRHRPAAAGRDADAILDWKDLGGGDGTRPRSAHWWTSSPASCRSPRPRCSPSAPTGGPTGG